MRLIIFIVSLLAPTLGFAQKATVASSASEWTTVKITATDTVAAPSTAKTKAAKTPRATKPKATTVAETAGPTSVVRTDPKPVTTPVRPTTVTTAAKPAVVSFLETFADNRHGWLTGKRNGYTLEIAKDSYYIRREKVVTRPGRSYIKLPDNLNLNKADTFTVSVEMVIPEGTVPDGGLLIGVKDTSNYCQFRLIGTSKVALYTRVNGVAQAAYMMGKPTAAKVLISPTRNTLTIRRTGEQLHFYINGKEVEDSPHPYRPFKGNGVGFISFADATKFQYLTVQVGK